MKISEIILKIGIGIVITSMLSLIIWGFIAISSNTHIEKIKVSCYDKMDNIINGVTCDESKIIYPQYINNMKDVILSGLAIGMLFILISGIFKMVEE